MYVNRRTFVLKPQYGIDEVRELIRLTLPATRAVYAGPLRQYWSQFGPWNLYAIESEFETLADYERLVPEVFARFPPEYWEKFAEVTDQGGSNEVWTLVE